MNKKVLIGVAIAIVVVIGGIIGVSKYTNTPDYVMKQYVDAINNKNMNKLDRITYKANQYKIEDIDEAYECGEAYEILSYDFYSKLEESSNTDIIKEVHFTYPEKVDALVDQIEEYTISGKEKDFKWHIELGRVNGRWKVISCPLLKNL